MYTFLEDGSIEVICGPMFSGKSEELIRRIRRTKIANQEIIVLKPSLDDRYGKEVISSHNGDSIEAYVMKDYNKDEMTFPPQIYNADVIAVDEVQFFNDSIVDYCEEFADNGKRVITAGLDTDFRGEAFETMEKLLPVADFIDKLAICVECGGTATKTQRLVNGEPASYDEPQILVGEKESYEARCRNCHEVKK